MLDFNPDEIRIPRGHFIGGKIVAEGVENLPVRRPSDSVIYADLPVASAEIVDRAVLDAQAAFRTSGWATDAPRARAAILRRWAELIDANKQELARLEALGSTRHVKAVIDIDIPYSVDCIRFFAEWADKLGGDVAATRADHLGMVITEPYGVVAAISPWNFPITQAITKIGPPLAAGNAVVLKPSELTPFSVLRLAELAIEAGMPPGILNIVQGTGIVTGDALCRHPNVGKISFTGSTRTGAAIMTASAESGIKPVTLELGGKSPQLVFADAKDLDKVADAVANSIIYNAGQVCIAGSRLIVQRGIEEALVGKIVARARKVQAGPTWSEGTPYGPIVSETQLQQIDDIVRQTVQGGAELLVGGCCMEFAEGGTYYEPTVLTRVSPEMEAVREEIFGPVLTVQSFDDEDEGFELAGHEKYGLAAGVHTGDVNKAMRAIRRIKAGTVWVNRYGRTFDYIIPTGGYNSSGIGKDLGRQAVEANMRQKSVLIDFAD
jgi:aldehyde dehydrogenase (NAD+)